MQLPLARPGGIGQGRHPCRGRHADGVQHGFNLGRHHHGFRGHENLAREPEVIADSIELVARGNLFDAIVVLVGCDKTIPGGAMALARLDIPGVLLYGGSIAPGRFAGHDVTIQDVFEAVGAHAAGRMSDAELGEIEANACPGAGACGGQFTANTMATACEFLGLAPMGSGDVPAVDSAKGPVAERIGELVMDVLKRGLRPSQVVTRDSLENAIAAVAATGGSTNAVLHLLAIAREAGVKLALEDFDRISARVPLLADLKPGGRFVAVDLHRAGGTRLVANRLQAAGVLHGDAMTVTGNTIGQEAAKAVETAGQQVVRPVSAPLKPTGGLVILRGNLAPDGCVVKVAGHDFGTHRGLLGSSTAKRRRSRPSRPDASRPATSSSSVTKDPRAGRGCAKCSASQQQSWAPGLANRWPS